MAIADYSDLKSTVEKYVARSDSTLSDQFDTFLTIAESYIYAGYGGSAPIRLQDMETEVVLTTVGGEVSLPANYLGMKSIINNNGFGYPLEYMSPIEFTGYSNGQPLYYTIIGTTLKVAPSFDGDIDIVYWGKYDPLTSGSPTNYLLTNHPNIYLQSILIEAYSFLRDDAQESKSTQKFVAALKALTDSERAKRYSGNTSRTSIRGGFKGNYDSL